jgi:hypothetical protein
MVRVPPDMSERSKEYMVMNSQYHTQHERELKRVVIERLGSPSQHFISKAYMRSPISTDHVEQSAVSMIFESERLKRGNFQSSDAVHIPMRAFTADQT